MKKPQHIYCEVYGRNFLVFNGWTEKEFESFMTKKYCSDIQPLTGMGGCHFVLEKNGEFLNIIWVKNKKDSIALIHECLHATVNVLNDAGVPVNAQNDESLCYYQGWLLKKVMEYKLK